MVRNYRLAWLGMLCAVASAGSLVSAQEAANNEAKIKQLIEQLGASEYAARQAAEQQLEQLGIETFDALEAAQQHEDLEISMRAQHLLKRFRVTAQESDPPQVKTLLKLYASQKTLEARISPLDDLARLPDRMGWSALGRLARLEQDEASSKYAALAILRQPWPTEAELSATQAALPSPTLTSKRRAVEWLKTYASTLREPSSTTAAWTKLVDEEFALLAKDKTRTSPLLATQLARWQVEYLRRVKQETIALKTLEHLASTIDPSQEDQLQEHIDWLADLEMWTLVVETERRFAAKFAENGPLLYRVSEAKLKLGDKATATELAEKAFQLNGDQIPLHVLAGQVLAQKGLFEWAEREYREALRIGSIGTMYDISIRSTLSELFHDQGEEQKAVDVLKPLVDASEKDEKVRQLIERSGRELDSIKSRMHHFVAIGHLTAGRFKEAEENFRLSFEEDSENIDAMIALYRLPNQSPEVHKRTLDDLHELIQESQRQITTHKRELEEADTANEQAYYKLRLAKDHNDYSWLVGNTEGDIDSAIRSSHESLKLRPGTAAYLDTLGRAYYSKGDYASAEKYQLEALRLEPHSGMMKRQLELIRNAAKSGTSKAAEKN